MSGLRKKLEMTVSLSTLNGEPNTVEVVDELLDEMIAASKRAFIANTSKWLEQVKDGKEFSLR